MIEWAGVIHATPGVDGPASFLVVSFIALLLPFCTFTGFVIMATKQKTTMMAQMKAFSLSKAKCVSEADRPLVENAIAHWFGYTNCSGSKGTGDVERKEAALAKFEECVRDGEVFKMVRVLRFTTRKTTRFTALPISFCCLCRHHVRFLVHAQDW